MARAQKAKFQMIELELKHGKAAEQMPEYVKAKAKLVAAELELLSYGAFTDSWGR